LYRKKTDGRRVNAPSEVDRTEIVKHIALDLWQKPNPFYSGARFVETIQQHTELCGEARILVSKNPRSPMPLELWPIRPDRIDPVPDAETFLAGYIYTGPNNEKIPLRPDEVISIIMPNPADPYRGLGPVQSLLTDLDATSLAGQWNRNFFLNDASPGGVIEMDEHLSDDEWKTFVQRWRAGHQGVANAHRVATLEQAHWVQAQFTMRDMQFAELRGVSREIIREAFAMHGHMLGLTDDINRANAEAAEDVYARWLLVPRLDRLKDALNTQLLPMFGAEDVMEFDFDDPSLEDSEANNAAFLSKAQSAKLLIEAGGEFTSVLEAVGLPEIEFDQAKVDREEKAKQAQADALKAAPDKPALEQKPEESKKPEPAAA
jgi:HK97 family phage portal protein